MVLLVVLCASVIYRISHPYQQQTVAKLKYAGRTEEGSTPGHSINKNAGSMVEDKEILMDLIVNPPRHSDKTVRDLFSMPEAAVAEVRADATGAEIQHAPSENGPVEALDPAARINGDIQQFHIFGLYEKGGEKLIFLEKGKDVLTVREGDLLEGKYRIERITDHEIVFKAEDLSGSVSVDINGL